ncbi:MAG: hypothetical protein OXT01_08100, partial [Rhodospirillaceae bacterium]|nr:hypothetical protein [Rhodospirillaceae bacterium]
SQQMGDLRTGPASPLGRWQCRFDGRCVPSDDALHGAGAANALEDAAVLSRCLSDSGTDDIASSFRRFEAARKPRTSRIQATSHRNEFMRQKTDPDWVYGYDAWTTPLP